MTSEVEAKASCKPATCVGTGPRPVRLDAGEPLPPGALGTIDYASGVRDAWVVDAPAHAPVRGGRSGRFDWGRNERWLFASATVDEDPGITLEDEVHDLYRELFGLLGAQGFEHVQRFWNYIPGINDASEGPERYRRFNTGRRRAFAEADRSLALGTPAACALGVPRARPLNVAFLAGRAAPVALENPRQTAPYRYPERYGTNSPGFSRAALVDVSDGGDGSGQGDGSEGGPELLLVSGTASIVGHETRHADDPAEQARETVRNLRAVIDAANRSVAERHGTARFELDDLVPTLYLRRARDERVVLDALAGAFGPESAAMRSLHVVVADICRSDLLVEIEAHAMPGGTLHRRLAERRTARPA